MARDFEIKTTFRAVDRTSRVINRMQSRLLKFTAKASMALRRLDRVASKLARGLGGILKRGAFIGAAAITGVLLAINRTAASMDELAKKTRAMQFPIEEFQEWRFAAEQAGVASEVFDKSLGKFTKTVGELKGGYGAMYTALKKTNPELLAQLQAAEDVDKAFEMYLGAINKTPGAMDKAALATAGFGRAGADMINLANMGADEISKLRAEMRQNGVVTAEQAATAEAYNDIMNSLTKTATSFVVDALTPMMPMLTKAAESMRAWMIANRGVIATNITEFFRKLPGYIEKIVYWAPKIAKYIAIFYGIVAAIKVAKATMWLFNKAALASSVSVKAVGTNSKTAMATTSKSTKAATKGVGKLQGAMGALTAFVIGWEIGTILHDKLVGPFMKARHEAQMLSGDLSDTMGRDLTKRGVAQLEQDKKLAQGVIKQDKESFGQSWRSAHGLGKSEDLLKKEAFLKKVESQLATARSKAKDNEELMSLGGTRGGAPAAEHVGAFSVGTITKSTEHKEVVDININDKTGRAEVAKGKGLRGLNLVHTGAAP